MTEPLLVLDTDWAPDCVIDWVADRLVASGCGATWFVTHRSPAIDRLRRYPELFELGIHPNFAPGSSHGSEMAEIIEHCFRVVPQAKVMRTHQLYQSTGLLFHLMRDGRIVADCSTFLPHARHPEPVAQWNDGRAIVRLPVIWEDDEEMERPAPQWRLAPILADTEGPALFACHPIHLYLNGRTAAPYRALKARVADLRQAGPRDMADLVCEGDGPRSLFEDVIAGRAGMRARRLADLASAVLSGAPA